MRVGGQGTGMNKYRLARSAQRWIYRGASRMGCAHGTCPTVEEVWCDPARSQSGPAIIGVGARAGLSFQRKLSTSCFFCPLASLQRRRGGGGKAQCGTTRDRIDASTRPAYLVRSRGQQGVS